MQSTTEPERLRADRAVLDSLQVLQRMASYLASNLEKARYIEASLERFTGVLGPEWQGLFSGFDALESKEKAERLSRLNQLLQQQPPAQPFVQREPKVRLLPEGLLADIPRFIPAPPLVQELPEPEVLKKPEASTPAVETIPQVEPVRAEPHRSDPPKAESLKAEPHRSDFPRAESVKPESIKPESIKPESIKPEPIKPESVKPESIPEAFKAEPPKPEPPKPEPPKPEPRTLALQHPEGTGAGLEDLSVFTEEELESCSNAGLNTIAELLVRAPTTLERAGERWLPTSGDGSRMIVRGVVRSRCVRFGAAGRRYEVRLATDHGSVLLRWSGYPSSLLELEVRGKLIMQLNESDWVGSGLLQPGNEVGFVGRLESCEDLGIETADGPLMAILYDPEILGLDGKGGDWLPRYDIPKVPDAHIRTAMRQALLKFGDFLSDHLPSELVERYRLLPLNMALKDAHFPANTARKGKQRMAFDEMIQVQLGVMLQHGRSIGRGAVHPTLHGLFSRAIGMAGWSLPDAQESAFDEIRRDLRRSTPMFRLLQGDVGAGKQLVIQAATLTMAESQFQTLFLAPDALTAEHRFLFAEAFYRSVGIEPVLLANPLNRTQLEGLRKGEILVAFATHGHVGATSLLGDCKRLGLVVVEDPGIKGFFDQQLLDNLPTRPDVLAFTPTPMPTSVLLSIYGGGAITTLPQLPSRGAETVVVPSDQREIAYGAAREAIALGQQVIIVLPLRRGQDLLSLAEARRLAEELSTGFLDKARINIFHGAMSREERFRAYDDFQHRRADALLATTFLEHGPVVPNASVLIVESAEHFDGIRLHRLRGLVTHGWWRGRCLLISAAPDSPAVELVASETDGYKIATMELKRLGIEATTGERPGEVVEFFWGDPGGDRELFTRTRQEAFKLLTQDPGLKKRSSRSLAWLVRARLGEEPESESKPERSEGRDARSESRNASKRRRRRK